MAIGTVCEQDYIDILMDRYRRIRPDIDWAPFELSFRIGRAALILDEAGRRVANSLELRLAENKVLFTILSGGPPFQMTPSQLCGELLSGSGAITNCIDRLVALGLVERRPVLNDGRSVLIRLTRRGRRIANELLGVMAEPEFEMIRSSLTKSEQDIITKLLRKLLRSIEARYINTDSLSSPRSQVRRSRARTRLPARLDKTSTRPYLKS